MVPEIDYDYIIVNMKKELDNFIFVDVVDETFFDKNALEKIENINKDLNRVIFIDYILYKSDLLKSFENEESIEKQFDFDFNRSSFYINNSKINTIDKEYLKNTLQENYMDLLLFCNQSLYGMPCNYIQNSIINQNLFVGNFNNNENKDYNLNFKIDINNNKISILSSKKLKIIQVFKNDLTVMLNVNIKIEIDIKNKSNILIELESSL